MADYGRLYEWAVCHKAATPTDHLQRMMMENFWKLELGNARKLNLNINWWNQNTKRTEPRHTNEIWRIVRDWNFPMGRI